MDSEDDTAVHYVRCLKCRKVLKCSRFDTSVLMDHIRDDHPEIEIVQNTDQKMSTPPCGGTSDRSTSDGGVDVTHYNVKSEQQKETVPEIKPCTYDDGSDTKVLYTRRYKVKTPPVYVARPPHKNNLYRTSIEKWRPANGTIFCPKCGCRKRPLIKTRSERFAYNSCGACCLLGCWPFCFLPCLFPGQNFEYLHCANCKAFLGLYDRDCNCIKPNREFMECNGKDKEKDKEKGKEKEKEKEKENMKSNEARRYSSSNILETNPHKPSIQFKGERDNVEAKSPAKSPSKKDKSTSPAENPTKYSNDPDRVPVVTIDGKEVDPEQVKRLSRYGKWAGVDMESLTSGNDRGRYKKEDAIVQKSDRRSL